MPISENFTSIFSKDWEIYFNQCYPNGLLKYTELCNILQQTAAAHSDLAGISYSDLQKFNQAWVLSRMRVEIAALPKWKEIVRVKTWISSIGNSGSVRTLVVMVDDQIIITSETLWVVLNTKTRRPALLALPSDHFELHPEKKSTQKRLSKIDCCEESTIAGNKTVEISDLDIVNHVNNVKYLEWSLDKTNPELVLSEKLESFEMNFTKELSLADKVIIHESVENNPKTFTISNSGQNCFALKLNFKST